MFRSLLWLLAFSGLVGAGSAQARSCVSEKELAADFTAEEYIFSVVLRRGNRTLSEGILAYVADGQLFVSPHTLALLLELPIPRSADYAAAGCPQAAANGYYTQTLLESEYAAGLEVDFPRLRLTVSAESRFPVEVRLDNERRWAALARTAGEGEDKPPPYVHSPYQWLEWPSLQLQGLYGYRNSSDQLTQRYDLQWTGDVMKSTGLLYAQYVPDAQDPVLFRGQFTRVLADYEGSGLPQRQPLRLTLGDISTRNDGLVARSRTGRGVELTNSDPADGSGEFGVTSLSGILPEGWSVELLDGREVIAVVQQAVDGEYRFDDVELEYGNNRFTLNFYGPNGERRTEQVSRPVSRGLLRRGRTRFGLQLTQSDTSLDGRDLGGVSSSVMTGDWLQARLERGLADSLTVAADVSVFDDGSAEQTPRTFVSTQGLAGLPWGVLFARATNDADADATALQLGASARLLGMGVGLAYREFNGLDTERSNTGNDDLLARSTALRLSDSLRLSRGVLAGRLNLERSVYESGRLSESASGTFTAARGSAGLTVRGEYQRAGLLTMTESARTVYSLRYRFGGVTFRGDVNQQVLPASEITQASLALDYWHSQHWQLQLRADDYRSSGETRYSLGISFRGEAASVTLGSSCGLDTDCQINLSFRVGISRDPLRARPLIIDPGVIRRGQVWVRGFEDVNQNGTWDSSEPGDIPLSVYSRGVKSLREEGLAVSGERPVDITVSEIGVEQPFLYARDSRLRVRARPGHTQVVDVPMVQTGEIEGVVDAGTPNQARPLPGLRVQIFDANGAQIREARSAYDGLFIAEKIPLGAYIVKVHPDDARRAGDLEFPEYSVQVREPGDIVQIGQLRAFSGAGKQLISKRLDGPVRTQLEARDNADAGFALQPGQRVQASVSAGATSNRGQFVLRSIGGRVQRDDASVLDASGEGIELELHDVQGGLVQSVQPGARGYFIFTRVPVGIYELIVKTPAEAASPQPLAVVVTEDTVYLSAGVLRKSGEGYSWLTGAQKPAK